MPALSPAVEARVSAIWAAACRTRRLFNGRVFSADTVTPTRIAGHWSEYRRVIAQMRDPGLVSLIGVRNLAVCGVLTCPEGVVVGRREARSAYQPGLWQMPPAGSVDHGAATPDGADWRRALLAELREEMGLGSACVRAMRPLCLVQHPSGVLDMGVRIDTEISAADMLAAHQANGDGEYDRVLILPAARLEAVIAAAGGTLVPSARPFLAAAALAGPHSS